MATEMTCVYPGCKAGRFYLHELCSWHWCGLPGELRQEWHKAYRDGDRITAVANIRQHVRQEGAR